MNRRQLAVRCGHRRIERGAILRFQGLILRDWERWGRSFPWRRARASQYHQVVSEVLLQRTRANTVAAYWKGFIAKFPTWESIANAPLKRVRHVLGPLGLANQRAP